MPEPILHHYPPSLFSEKIRLLLGYTGLDWQSVIIPSIMPRPFLMPMTGGYRKTPVMQIGANIYCDTKIISLAVAERAGRTTALYPAAGRFVAHRIADWADTQLFQVAVAICFQPRSLAETFARLPAAEVEAFQKDRAELSQGAAITRYTPEVAEAYLGHYLEELEESVSDAFVLGGEPTIADFAVYHCLWLIANNPVVAPQVRRFERVSAWMDRMAAFGHGVVSELAAEDALAVARDAQPQMPEPDERGLPEGIALGDQVDVAPVDYGMIPVRGELVRASRDEIAVKRHHDDCGAVVTHFPRVGFSITAA